VRELKRFQIILFVREPMFALRFGMRRQPVEIDFSISITESFVEVHFAPTDSLYVFARFKSERDIDEFGPVSPDPVEQHRTRNGVRSYNAGEVRAMAFRLATATTQNRSGWYS
jgi:hypothetical protein